MRILAKAIGKCLWDVDPDYLKELKARIKKMKDFFRRRTILDMKIMKA